MMKSNYTYKRALQPLGADAAYEVYVQSGERIGYVVKWSKNGKVTWEPRSYFQNIQEPLFRGREYAARALDK